MEPLRILLVSPYFYPLNYGGAPVVYRTIADSSCNVVNVFTSITPESAQQCLDFDRSTEFSIYRSKNLVFHVGQEPFIVAILKCMASMVRQISSLLHLLIKVKPDIIICGNVSELGWLVWVCSFFSTRTKVASYVHGEELTMTRGKGLWAKFLQHGYKQVLLLSSKIIVVSNYTRTVLLQQGLPDQKIEVITNGVNLAKYFPVKVPAATKIMYGVQGKKVILSLSRLVPKKGFDKVIEALASIIEDVPDVVYVLGGTGPDRERLEALARQYKVENYVVFAGFIKETCVNDFLNLADVFVMPNRAIAGDTEGFGLVFLEANACGIPVIGGIDGGTSDAIVDGVTGYRVDGRRVDILADNIKTLLIDHDLRLSLGEQGRKWVVNEHGWDEKVRLFDRIMEAI